MTAIDPSGQADIPPEHPGKQPEQPGIPSGEPGIPSGQLGEAVGQAADPWGPGGSMSEQPDGPAGHAGRSSGQGAHSSGQVRDGSEQASNPSGPGGNRSAGDPSGEGGGMSGQGGNMAGPGAARSGQGGKRAGRETGAASRNRRSLTHRVRYALRHPRRVPAHARRVARDTWLQLKHRDHISYYRAVMAADTARSPEAAVGHNPSVEKWERMGRMQFEYLLRHGLEPRHRMLEIGCGNLRAGRLFIDHLDTGNYYGIDISPAILMEAQRTLAREGLQAKLPHLALVADLTFSFLPAGYFDVVHAHSVFSHSPPHVIEQCLAHVGRVLAPGGFFDFTFGRTEGAEHQVLHEDFYYRTETLVELARKHGLSARLMDDWEDLPHRQSKIRATVAEEAGGRADPDVGTAP